MIVERTQIYFRADGNTKIGLGHIIRSLALVDMLKDDFDCHFVTTNLLPLIKKTILSTCSSLIELEEFVPNEAAVFAKKYLKGDEIVVLDGYHFGTEYQKTIKQKGCKLVCIDDIHAYHFVADAVVSHAPSSTQENFDIANYTQLFLGFDYALLRKPFLLAAQETVIASENIGSILICFGGSDIHNLTCEAVSAIREINELQKIDVLVGNAFENMAELEKLACNNHKVIINKNKTAEEVAELLKKTDLAIVSASTISFEVFATQTRMICGYYVDNQIEYYNYLEQNNLAICVGNFLEGTPEAMKGAVLRAISSKDRLPKPIDGQIKNRYLKLFSDLSLKV